MNLSALRTVSAPDWINKLRLTGLWHQIGIERNKFRYEKHNLAPNRVTPSSLKTEHNDSVWVNPLQILKVNYFLATVWGGPREDTGASPCAGRRRISRVSPGVHKCSSHNAKVMYPLSGKQDMPLLGKVNLSSLKPNVIQHFGVSRILSQFSGRNKFYFCSF